MYKIPETILRLIWSYQFLFLELPQSEVDESQGKPKLKFLTPYAIDVMLINFNPLINLFYLTQFEGLLSHYHLPMDQTYFDFLRLLDLRKMSPKS